MKKVGDLNQILYNNYAVDATNKFKKFDLVDRVPEELRTEVYKIVQEAMTSIAKKRKCKRGKWLSKEALQIAEERGKTKSKGESEIYIQLNAEFQRIARRDEKVFFDGQGKEVEGNNRMGNLLENWSYQGNIS